MSTRWRYVPVQYQDTGQWIIVRIAHKPFRYQRWAGTRWEKDDEWLDLKFYKTEGIAKGVLKRILMKAKKR